MDITLNASIRKYTAFKNMDDMLNTHPNYRPSCNTKGCSTLHRAMTRIANAYDRKMIAMGIDKKAYRY